MMIFWGQLNLQESSTSIIEALNYFHDYIIVILLSILVSVTYVFLFIIFSPRLDKYTVESHTLETLWTVAPMVILLFIAFPSLFLLYLIEDAVSPSVTVKVVGHQWYWEYQYSNSWLTYTFDSYMLQESPSYALYYTLDVDNRLVLPTLLNILFLVTSADVLHSWTVPTLGFKADACPGRINSISTICAYSGVYYGQCREICGSNHRFMPIVLEFVPLKSFLSFASSLE